MIPSKQYQLIGYIYVIIIDFRYQLSLKETKIVYKKKHKVLGCNINQKYRGIR